VARAAAPTPVLVDEMTGGRPVLQLSEPSSTVHIVRQAVERAEGAAGDAEHVTLSIPPGRSAALTYPLPEAVVLDELKLEAVVWCNRPGMTLAAVIELPRTIDPATGRPRRLTVRSEELADGGAWERLKLHNLPQRSERQARIARATYGPDIDEQGAYVSQLVLLVPGGIGPTEAWVDQVALYGVLRSRGVNSAVDDAEATSNPPEIDLAAAWTNPTAATSTQSPVPRNSPPAMPRIIQWQGEPLELLRRIGFDTVWMGRLPNAAELAEASRLGLWLVCPPPAPETLAVGAIGPEFDGVLAWDLGELASPEDVALAETWARALERRERLPNRPTVLRPRAMSREASRIADVIVVGRPTMGSTASWPEYAAWLTHTRRLARPGVSLWTTIETQRSTNAAAQLAALRGGGANVGAASYRYLSQATAATIGVWPRGFWFHSQSTLAAGDVETRMRVLALELTNLRLGMIEPWLARGKMATPARSSQPDLTAMVLTVERSHLVIPMRWNYGATAADSGISQEAPTPKGPLTLLLQNVPESCEAYLLSVAGPRHLPTRRVTGGVSVTVEDLPDDAFLLLTEDGYAFARVERRLRAIAARAAQARVELAALYRQQATDAAARLSPALLKAAGGEADLAASGASMTAIHRTLASQDFAAAYARAAASDAILDALLGRLYRATWPDRLGGASPLPSEWTTLADQEQLASRIAGSMTPPVSFPGGRFEDLAELLESGWRRSEYATPGIAGAVRLSPDGPHAGDYCLELEARTVAQGSTMPALATPPVWITSPPLVVPAGHLVEIRGWVRVVDAPIGSADPLLIFDSIGGEESAVRVSASPSWRPFRLVRAAPAGTEFRLTVALGGVGQAAVDSLEYRFVPLPIGVARR
jgi:hypothetical protein